MNQPPPYAGPEAAARPVPPPPGPALQLSYATPQPKAAGAVDFGDVLIIVIRRLVFAVGVGLLVAGLVHGFGEGNDDDAAALAGVGAGMVALVVPFRKLSEPVRVWR